MEILINNLQGDSEIDSEVSDLITKVSKRVLEVEKVDKEVSIALVDNQYIKELNDKYRSKNEATDVLSFPQEDENLLGDIIISIPRAKEQAQEYNHSLAREIGFLTVHGMLHLTGYDHHEPQKKEKMRAKEEEILAHFDLSRD
ncbi:rRNA maturation RNase YbeY [Halanaerobacter jeridensis]|uniref:Endoribonuclease YbeY n=1 Tax=Halanaerobacter jeridensis TaxID=706427 RepID=A0A938XNU0_9FIRM|nr:rRNA maturation RNase YbeY [Halanaerobacter jeridensis]MBM7556243.1 putative rRNA maturation factor [Halanaerobacter jeridensis]